MSFISDLAGPIGSIGGFLVGGPVGAAIGGGLGNAISQHNQNQDMKGWNERMWNLNNKYNSPLEQRRRLVEAGYSPALMYGNGTVGNTSGAAAAPNIKPIQTDAPTLLNAQLQAAQIANIRADTDNKIAENPYIAGKQPLQEQNIQIANLNRQYLNETLESRKSAQQYDTQIKAATSKVADATAQAKLNEINERIKLLVSNGKRTELQSTLLDYEKQMREWGLSFGDELQFRLLFAAAKKVAANMNQ